MMTLNPTLYQALKERVGKTSTINAGKRMEASYRPGASPESIQLEIGKFGESYKVNCPICGDKKKALCVSHRYGRFDCITGSFNIHLAKCFRRDCLADPYNREKLAQQVLGFVNRDMRMMASKQVQEQQGQSRPRTEEDGLQDTTPTNLRITNTLSRTFCWVGQRQLHSITQKKGNPMTVLKNRNTGKKRKASAKAQEAKCICCGCGGEINPAQGAHFHHNDATEPADIVRVLREMIEEAPPSVGSDCLFDVASERKKAGVDTTDFDARLGRLQAGDMVKLCFLVDHEEGPLSFPEHDELLPRYESESMWVRILDRIDQADNVQYRGELWGIPELLDHDEVRIGSAVIFEPRHVLAIAHSSSVERAVMRSKAKRSK